MTEALQGLADGFAAAISPTNLFWAFFGVVAGTLVGVLPGLGTPATIAILLPLSVNLPPAAGLIMMASIYYGSKYGGSTTSILLNIPGEDASVVTALDGYQMAKEGRAGQALGIAAIGSFIAGTIGLLGLTFFAPVVADLAIVFGPPEYAGLMILGLSLIILLAGTSKLKALIAGVFGFLLSTVGLDLFTGAGAVHLWSDRTGQWSRVRRPEHRTLRHRRGNDQLGRAERSPAIQGPQKDEGALSH